MEQLLTVKNIYKNFRVGSKDQLALQDITFEVNRGEFVCIVGPSGCGKSTLLRIISHLASATSGQVNIPADLKMAMVFQNFALFPWLDVEENVSFGLRMQGESKESANRKCQKYIKEIGLSGVENKHPKELSGGMRQRVGIARALAVEPELLLLDEPFSALDVFTANKLRQDLLSIWKNNNLTVLMVSHLIEEAVELADKIVVLSANPGEIKSVETVSLPRPRNTRSSEFYKIVDKVHDLITLS